MSWRVTDRASPALPLSWLVPAPAPQVRAGLRPRSSEIGMRQRFALVAVEKNDTAGFGLALAQLQAQADPIDLAGRLTSFQRVPRPPPTELFFRKALDNCERLMHTPSRASISARSRAIVQLCRSATGSSSKGVTTRKAVALFTGSRAGREARLQRIDTASAEIAAPQPNRILTNAERFSDPRASPARQRQQHSACPVRFAAITRPRKSRQGNTLLFARCNRRLSTHATPTRIGTNSESQNQPVGQPSGIRIGWLRWSCDASP